jgi:cobalt-zinc-cadmium efflux system protein
MTHNHNHNTTSNIRLAFVLNLSFALLEIFGAIWTNSLAILSDAIHDLGDSLSLALAWYLEKYAEKGGDHRFSYGYRRFSLLGALLNTVILIIGSLYVLFQAIPRLLNPEPTNAKGMVVFALVGIAVNGLAVLVLVMSIVMIFTDYYILDPILSILITLYILYNVIRNLKKTLSLFLQAVPESVDILEIEEKLRSLEHVLTTHHTHIWSLDGEHHVLTTHVVLHDQVSTDDVVCIREEIKWHIKKYGFTHSTIEFEIGEEDCMMGDL